MREQRMRRFLIALVAFGLVACSESTSTSTEPPDAASTTYLATVATEPPSSTIPLPTTTTLPANPTPEVNDDGRPFVLWSFESGRLSADGTELKLDVFHVPDPACYEYNNIETEVVGDQLVVSLYYLGPTPGQYCSAPCPLDTSTGLWTLESPVDPSLEVVENPATEPHCAETTGS
jgi:hypothetical protein